MIAALRRTGGALLAVGMTVLGPLAPAAMLAQTRPYNPLVRKVATEEELPAPAMQAPAKPSPSKAASSTPSPSKPAPPAKAAAPKAFRPAANAGWQTIQQPGSNRPPIMVPPVSTRSRQPTTPAENLPPPQAAGEVTEHSAGPPEVGATEWDDGSPWPEGESDCGPDCGDGACGGCGDCDDCCGPRFTLLGCIWPRNLSLFGGVHGFKGPVDQGRNGNFGFHEGLNLAGGIKPACGIGYQVGAQFAQSNFAGHQVVQATTETRDQFFITSGLFRKAVHCCDWQGGIVYDLLHDDYYVDMTLAQVRGELSFVGPHRHEVGLWFTAGVKDDTAQTINEQNERWESTDLYACFYRKNLDCGVNCRAWAGFSGRSDALIGGDLHLPFSDCWAMQANFNFLIPEEGASAGGASEESWMLGLNLVWSPCAKTRCQESRPLFNVADNGTFMVDRRIR